MLLLLAVVLLSSAVHADNQSSLEVSFANYGWEQVEFDRSLSLASFQWRLGHQWQGRRDTLAAAFSYKRIRLQEEDGGLFDIHVSSSDGSIYHHAFYLGSFEARWTRRLNRSWAVALLLMPSITAEDKADENRYPLWGEFLVSHKGLGLGVGRLEVSGRLRWWPLVSVRRQWRGIRFEGLFPRYGYVQKGPLKLSARLEGATYLVEDDWDTFQPLYFSHLDLAAAVQVSEGGLEIAFEMGRTVHRRFEVATLGYQYQSIDDGWYIRTSLRYPSTIDFH